MIKNCRWICSENVTEGKCVVFQKTFKAEKTVKKAYLEISAKGVYEAFLNGNKLSYVLAPGCTSYHERIQYQTYDVTDVISGKNTLEVGIGSGWYAGRISDGCYNKDYKTSWKPEIIACLTIQYSDGEAQLIKTDGTWKYSDSKVLYSDIYDGEIYDAAKELSFDKKASPCDDSTEVLIPQEGEIITEQDVVYPCEILRTPKGETVIDFGQNLTGYPVLSIDAKRGDKVSLSFGEVLDRDGNFYNANYRSAKCRYEYHCVDGMQSYTPHFTFYGFRYVRVDEFPTEVTRDNFKAVVVCSQLKRTGYLSSSNEKLNRLFSNIIWGQKGNYLDVPTDCPQRDERKGWTGDAQMFVRAGAYNFDTEKFFKKWMRDLYAEQKKIGEVPHVIPFTWEDKTKGLYSSAWADAAVICPWEIYLAYGDVKVLREQYASMKAHVDWIEKTTIKKNLWIIDEPDRFNFGDWLGLDAPEGSYKGSTNISLISSGYYAYDSLVLSKAAKILGKDKDAEKYARVHDDVVKACQTEFPEYKTQTECVVALYFGFAKNKKKTAKQLADMIKANGNRLQTGFVGAPYLLHALSDNGYEKLAYTLLLQEKFPSWLFSVNQGATTIWEHWDGQKEDGTFWSTDMNSFNHYAYGAVADWVYDTACGIRTSEDAPGYGKVVIKPLPDKRLSFLEGRLETRHGIIVSRWEYIGNRVRHEITTPCPATIVIGDKTYEVGKGTYLF